MSLVNDSLSPLQMPYFLRGSGEMGKKIFEYNWSENSIGAPHIWPSTLKASLNIILHSDEPMMILWGDDQQVVFYNDACADLHFKDVVYNPSKAEGNSESFQSEQLLIDAAQVLVSGVQLQNEFAKLAPVYSDNDQPHGVLVTFTKPQSVTPEQQFQNLIRHATVGIAVVTGDDCEVRMMNDVLGQLVGRNAMDSIGKPMFEMLPETAAEFRPLIENVLVTGKPQYLYDYPYFVYVGEEKKEGFLNIIYQPYIDENAQIQGVMILCHDVTEEIATRQIAEQRKHIFRQLVDEAPVAIALFKGEDLIIDIANDQIMDLWNVTDVVGKPLLDAVPALKGQPFFDQLVDVYKTGKTYIEQNATVNLRRDGELRRYYFDITFKPMNNADGEIFGVMDVAVDVTDKVLAQQRITESEQKLKSVVESAPFPIGVYVGREMIIELANQSILDIWGKGNDVIGKSYTEVLPELENQKVFEQLQQVYDTGQPLHIKNAQIDLIVDGKLRVYFFDYSFTPVFDSEGNTYGVMNTAADVTELNLASQKLSKSERNLRNIIQQSPVAMCILLGEDFVVDIANERMYELWGIDQEQVLHKSFFEAHPATKNQGLEDLLLGVYRTGKRFSAFELPVILPRDGVQKTVYINFVYEAFYTSEDEIGGVMAVAVDVTEQVLARKQIEQAEERARLAIESADLASYELDIETDEIKSSPRFHEIFGRENAADRLEYTSQFHPDDIEIRNKAHADAFMSGNLHYEARIVHPDNSVHWIRAKGLVIFDGNQPKKLIGIIQDITEQKQFAEELSTQVRKQTLELKRSNEDLLQFAHVASHDLKEPVRKIKVFASRLEDEFSSILPERGRAYLDKVHNATNRMFAMIDGVLSYSTLNANEQKLEEINLNQIFKNIESDLEIVIQQKKATINVSHLPVIQGAQVLIHQLFYNLINNSLKFSKTDVPPVIDVKSEVINRFGHKLVRIIVSDNGIGIEPEYADKIFGAFARLNAKEQYEGTGLGLSLCKRIVERHYGSISATGKAGEGAEFTIMLPMEQIEQYI